MDEEDNRRSVKTKKMKGYKTYTGIALIVLGWLGLSQYVTDSELNLAVDNLLQFAGTLLAIYGRYKAGK